jgi:peroxiredoxin
MGAGIIVRMGTVTVAARVFVAIVFASAAITKLRHPQDIRTTFREFGVGESIAKLAILLPPAELVVSMCLLITPTARWAAMGAVLLLLIFLAGIANALRLGRRPDCGCFGGFGKQPIGRSTVVRNGVLLTVAAFVAVRGSGPALDAWVTAHGAGATILLAIAVIAAIATLLGASGSLQSVPESAGDPALAAPLLTVGDLAPEISLTDMEGKSRRLASLGGPSHQLVLIFGNSSCGSCAAVLSQLTHWEAALAQRVRFAVIAGRDAELARAVRDQYGASTVLVDEAAEAQQAFGVRFTPTAFAITPDGLIASGPAAGPDAVEDLVRLTLHRLPPMTHSWSQTSQVA